MRLQSSTLVVLVFGCTAGPRGTVAGRAAPDASSAPAPASSVARAASTDPARDAGTSGAENAQGETTRRTSSEAERILFPQSSDAGARCAPSGGRADEERVRCLVTLRFEADPEAARIATALLDASDDVAGVEHEHVMQGGFRGTIHIVPEPPVGRYRSHLAWVSEATQEFDRFFGAIGSYAKKPIRYRWRGLGFKFFRSVGRTTPSAYADESAGISPAIGYNVSGSLNRSADSVRETLFHEIFHLNDHMHGWSDGVLGSIYDGIVRRCGTRTACLTPYAPNGTMVRGGTYYAFQPNNGDGVAEYAAELAIRYYREQRAMFGQEAPLARPFKCGPSENARAWSLLVDEFFGGADRTPPCKPDL
jgi:hypothetical protein